MKRTPVAMIESPPAILLEDHVDTDQIVPARFLTSTKRTGFGEACFRDRRFDAAGQPRLDFTFDRAVAGGARVLVAGANFGCGSSREHAVWALIDAGISAVIAPSFADIFRSNAGKNGLLAVALALPSVERCAASPRLAVDLERLEVVLADGSAFPFEIDPFTRYCLRRGIDELDFLLEHIEPAPAAPSSEAR